MLCCVVFVCLFVFDNIGICLGISLDTRLQMIENVNCAYQGIEDLQSGVETMSQKPILAAFLDAPTVVISNSMKAKFLYVVFMLVGTL